MENKSLIPEGFKDHVDFNTNVEHEYKNKIINIFISNGFDLVKTPLLEFYKKNNDNCFTIKSNRKELELFVRDDITPQIIRIASSRFKNKIRPIKLCYYGEVTRKKGSMLRPERQFLQVGSEIIGTDSILADIEIINLAYQSLNEIGTKAVSLHTKENNIIEVVPESEELGFVGIPNKINNDILLNIIKEKKIPIVSPLGLQKNQTFNINGDTAAGAIAKSLKSRRLLLMTNVKGVLDKEKKLIEEISSSEILEMVKNETITEGMITKINTCLDAINNGVTAVGIIDGREKHSILFEIFSDKGSGTLIRK